LLQNDVLQIVGRDIQENILFFKLHTIQFKNSCICKLSQGAVEYVCASGYFIKHSLHIHSYHLRFIPKELQRYLRSSSKTPTFYQNDLAMKNTTEDRWEAHRHLIAVYLRYEGC
jgi:hypothetical protein